MENVQTCLFDKCEVYPNCTVEIFTNTVTGEQSIGWWPNDDPPIKIERKDEVEE